MLKAQEVWDMSEEEILFKLEEARKELFALLNAGKMLKKMAQPHLKREKRKEIARLLTILHSREKQG